MSKLTEIIDKQIAFNQGKNIFLDSLDIFQFAKDTVNAIAEIDNVNPEAKRFLIDYASDKAIEEFYRLNQYYSFDINARNNLRTIYSALFEKLETRNISIDDISRAHYENLKHWLKENSHFGELYKDEGDTINPVACSEYSPKLQIEILKIEVEHLLEPFLDIGCGMNGYLVNYLTARGIKAYGIDRAKFQSPGLMTADWLDYDYGKNKWGTIVSNLGFSNHFNHHHLRESGNYIAYGKTYMNILHSLKNGGHFHYAPDLPFIERYLDNNQFQIDKFEINQYNFKAVKIKKLK
jgi:hypothetical protein